MLTQVVNDYKAAYKKLLLLDYDGTLVNFASTPDKAVPTLRLLNILTKLSRKPSVKLVITTGREARSIDTLIGHIPVDIIAEHGASIKEHGMWRDLIAPDESWKDEILSLMEKITGLCPGSWIETKRFSISWHYRNASSTVGYILSRRLIRMANVRMSPHEVRILDGNKTVEVMTKAAGKSKAVQYCLAHTSYDFILSIGDDKTDEDMFEALSGMPDAVTIKVGHGNTSARHQVASIEEVLELLEQL